MVSTTTSEIAWPRPGMAGCMFCRIVRDTRGVTLDHAQRFNFFPASPVCSLVWLFAGDCHLIDGPDQIERPWTGARLPKLAFFGPQLGPLASWNPSETYAMTITFYPDALSGMTGLDLSPFAGRMVPAEEVLPQPLLQPCRDLFDAIGREGAERAFSVLEDSIETLWASTRPAGTRAMRSIEDWSTSLVRRAALTDLGRKHKANRTADQIMDRCQPARPAWPWPHRATLCPMARGNSGRRCRLGGACRGVRICRPAAYDPADAAAHRLHARAIAPERERRRGVLGLSAAWTVF